MPKSARSTQSEYVKSADVNILSHAIDNIITGESVTNFNWEPSHVQYYWIFK